jgi:hypothetical protein
MQKRPPQASLREAVLFSMIPGVPAQAGKPGLPPFHSLGVNHRLRRYGSRLVRIRLKEAQIRIEAEEMYGQ